MKKNDKNSSILKEMDLKVIVPSMAVILSLIIYCILNEDTAMETFSSFFNNVVINFTSLYMWYPVVLTGMGVFFIFSKYGNVVLGKPDDKPEMPTFKYVAVILAMAFGATIMRTGLINWASSAQSPAFGIVPFSHEAMIFGNAYEFFIWGFPMFAVFGLASPAIGYYLHVRQKSTIKLSVLLGEVFGDKFKNGILGKLCDFVFIVAFVCGGATCVGFAAPVVAAVLGQLIGINAPFELQVGLTLVIVVIFTTSCMLGLKKGIEKLSEFNIYMAIAFIALIIILGPTLFIFDFFTDSIRFMIDNYVHFSFYANSGSDTVDHLQSYTVFWWAYSAGWAILHSSFLAIISKGRTIRQMLLTYFLAPQVIVLIFTTALGGLGVHRFMTGEVPLLDVLETSGNGVAAAQILETLPMSNIMMVIYVVLSVTFLATTMDSYTYTGASYVTLTDISNGVPSRKLRMMWAFLIAAVAITMMFVGGLAPLSVVNGIIGIPMMAIQGLVIYAAIKMMNDDKAYLYNVREKEVADDKFVSRYSSAER